MVKRDYKDFDFNRKHPETDIPIVTKENIGFILASLGMFALLIIVATIIMCL